MPRPPSTPVPGRSPRMLWPQERRPPALPEQHTVKKWNPRHLRRRPPRCRGCAGAPKAPRISSSAPWSERRYSDPYSCLPWTVLGQIPDDLCRDHQTGHGGHESRAARNVPALSAFVLRAGRTNTMAATADAHILNGADGRFVRPYHLQMSDSPLLQFPTHHPSIVGRAFPPPASMWCPTPTPGARSSARLIIR